MASGLSQWSPGPGASLARDFVAAGLDWIVPDWPAPPNVRAFSTTRRGRDGMSFDVGSGSGGLDRARNELLRWVPAEPLWLTQVHGTGVHVIESIEASRNGGTAPGGAPPGAVGREPPRRDGDGPLQVMPDRTPRGDAVVTQVPNVVCAVRSADCLPVLFCDRAGTVVAATHAGWRGLSAGVLEATIDAMRVPPADLMAWMGPAIGPTRFEVGADVLTAFAVARAPIPDAFTALAGGKWLANLYALARARLHSAGVTSVHGGGACTYDDAQRFYSYRRGGDAGRMATVVWRVDQR